MIRILLFLSIILTFGNSLDKGLYLSEQCMKSFIDVNGQFLTIFNTNSKKDISYVYHKKNDRFLLTKTREFYPEDNSYLKIDNKQNFKIFNTDKLLSCKGLNNYKKVTSIKSFVKFLKNIEKPSFPITLWTTFRNYFLINKKNVKEYMTLAQLLFKADLYKESKFILENILESFPDNTLAYLYYANTLDNFNSSKRVTDKYNLTYIAQMLLRNKEKNIPKALQDKYKTYFPVLQQLNLSVKEPYTILDFTKVDFDNDYVKEFSFVIELADYKKIDKPQKLYYRLPNKNNRIWLVFSSKNGKYTLIGKNSTLLKADTNTKCKDSFDSLLNSNNSLSLNIAYSCHREEETRDTYQVLYKDKKLILARYERDFRNWKYQIGKKLHINFLTKVKEFSKTSKFGKSIGNPKISKIKDKTPIEFENIYAR